MMKKQLLPFVLLALISLAYFFRQFQYPAFNLIDDGYSLYIAQQLTSDFSATNWHNTLIESELAKGRLRPGYYLYYLVVYLLAGEQPLAYWLAQAVTLGATLSLIYFFTREITKKPTLAFIGTVALLGLPALMENYFRLGPAETRQLLWLLLGFFFLYQSLKTKTTSFWREGLVIGSYFWALLTKETTLLALPAWLIFTISHWVLNWQSLKNTFVFHKQVSLVLTLVLGSLIFIFLLPSGQGYSSSLNFSLATAKANLFAVRVAFPEFHWLAMVGGLLLLKRWLAKRSLVELLKKDFALSIHFLVLGLIFLNFPLFWQYQLERYYLLGQVFIWLFLMGEVGFLTQLKIIKQQTRFLILGWLLLTIGLSKVLFLPHTFNPSHFLTRSANNWQAWYQQYQYSQALINYLQTKLEPEAKLFVLYNDYEVIYEIGLYASRFFNQPVTIYSENSLVSQNFGKNYLTETNLEAMYLKLEEPAVLMSRGVPLANSQPLWPSDNLLRDNQQVWFIVSNQTETNY